MAVRPLSPKQKDFVAEYLKDHNATAAALRAKYKHPNKQGPRLLVNVGVREMIDKAIARVQEEAILTAADVVKGLLAEARDHSEGTSQAGRVSAWAWLGKTFGMFTDGLEIKGEVTVRIKRVIVDAASRAGDNGRAASGTGGLLPEQ